LRDEESFAAKVIAIALLHSSKGRNFRNSAVDGSEF
jgi:hypothetical protein